MDSQSSGRICVFCGAAARSREHLWPDWLNEVLPNYAQTTYTLRTAAGEEHRWPSAKPATHRIAAVCSGCNEGWMSKLEGAAKPLLIPLINGQKQKLSKSQQRTIAAWAFKTAAVAEQLNPPAAAIPNGHREYLKAHGEPPPGCHVFITATDAKWIGETFYKGQGLEIDRGPDGGSGVAKGYVGTIAMRHLAFQVIGSVIEEAEFAHNGPGAESVLRIWPTLRRFTWPPGAALQPEDLRALADHWQGNK